MKNKGIKIIKEYLQGLTSLIYPNFCVICNKELNQQSEHFCFICEQDLHYTYFEKYNDYSIADQVFWGRLKIETVYSLLYFEEASSTKNILHHIKYTEGKELAHYMGQMMGKKLKNHPKLLEVDALIPIPVHSKKEFLRGYNQSLLIAKGLSEELGVPIVDALYRKSHDKSQTKKSKDERHENVKGKFGLKKEGLSGYKHVMIIDDVLTTGSTLEFASRAVLESIHEIKVSLGTIAVAQ